MARLLILLILIIVVAMMLGRFSGGRRGTGRSTAAHGFPYRRRKSLFTPAERSFLGVLEREVEGRYRVFGKVRLADLLEVFGAAANERAAAFNRISAKHVDFVLCREGDLSVVAAIELDDASHAAPARQGRDAFLADACRAAGLPLLRFPVKASYTVAEVRTALAALEEPIVVHASSARGARD